MVYVLLLCWSRVGGLGSKFGGARQRTVQVTSDDGGKGEGALKRGAQPPSRPLLRRGDRKYRSTSYQRRPSCVPAPTGSPPKLCYIPVAEFHLACLAWRKFLVRRDYIQRDQQRAAPSLRYRNLATRLKWVRIQWRLQVHWRALDLAVRIRHLHALIEFEYITISTLSNRRKES